MNNITEAFYNVMYQYKLAFTPDGVQANLDQWRQMKTPLLELLRRLNRHGMDLPLTAITVDECARAIFQALHGAEGK